MSTRAVYTFFDQHEEHSVYKHHDGYPEGALEFIKKAVKSAWPLPRFEPDDFGAAFVAANRDGPGGVYLTKGPETHSDLSYLCRISCRNGRIYVQILCFGNNSVSEGYLNNLLKVYCKRGGD